MEADLMQDAATPMAIASKQRLLLSLLQRSQGASIPELVAVTQWQAKSVHSALSTLRSRGMAIRAVDGDDVRRYVLEHREE